jgi:hypothetical protein
MTKRRTKRKQNCNCTDDSTDAAELRREYNKIKEQRRIAGEALLNGTVTDKGNYQHWDELYHRVGKQLGQLTGKKTCATKVQL